MRGGEGVHMNKLVSMSCTGNDNAGKRTRASGEGEGIENYINNPTSGRSRKRVADTIDWHTATGQKQARPFEA